MKLTTKLRTLLTVVFLTCSLSLVHAQPGPGDPGDPGGDPGGGNTSAPFDGGLSLLVAAGIGYAAKKKYDKRKKENAVDITENSGLK